MPLLPFELVDDIIDASILKTEHTLQHLAILCRVDKRTYCRYVTRLYEAPVLHRHNIRHFLHVVEEDIDSRSTSRKTEKRASDYEDADVASEVSALRIRKKSLASLVKHVAFIAVDLPLLSTDGDHEHVDNDEIFECLELVSSTLQCISIDMACSHAGCGWHTRGVVQSKAVDRLSLPSLKTLTCRCPKGYLPLKTRKLIELLRLGQAPNLETLNLVCTAPGPFDSPIQVANITQALKLCLNVVSLCIITTQVSMNLRPYLVVRPCAQVIKELSAQPNADVPNVEQEEEISGEGISATPLANSRSDVKTDVSSITPSPLSVTHITGITQAMDTLQSSQRRSRILELHIGTIYTPKARRHNAKPLVETLRQIGHDAGWRAFVALQLDS